MKKTTLDFCAKAPVQVFLEEDRTDHRSGCSILDVSFADPVSIGEIHFRNYYTCLLSILCKRVPLDKDVRNRELLPWVMSVRRFSLMTNPHCEQGSQDIVVIPSSMSFVPFSGIVAMRFILKQPSAHWRKFGIEDLSFHKETFLKEKKPPVYVPRMFSGNKGDSNNSLLEVRSKDSATSTEAGLILQSLKHLAEQMKTVYTGATVGRFEVDGSYDISHLV